MTCVITRTLDILAPERTKWIHPLGLCGKVKLVLNDAAKRYTGLF